MEYLSALPPIIRIIVVSLSAYIFQLLAFLLLLGGLNKSGREHPQAEAIKCLVRDTAVLLSSLISFVGCSFVFPDLLSPFHWKFFMITLALGASGWVLDYFGFRNAPILYYDEINIHNKSLRWTLVVVTPLSIILYHLANIQMLSTGEWQVSLMTIFLVGSMITFGMYFGRVFSRLAVLSSVIR